MNVIFGILSGVMYGTAYFVAGQVSKRSSILPIAIWSQLVGCLTLIPLAVLVTTMMPQKGLTWGIIAGLSAGFGLALLYRGLATGRMNVVSPTAAIVAALTPVMFSIVIGEQLTTAAYVGIMVALPAIAAISAKPRDTTISTARFAVGEALAAGLFFGFVFIALDRTEADSGLWPLVFARGASVVLLGVGALVLVRSVRLAPRTTPATIASGLLDTGALVAYLLAARSGSLATATVLSSLYPAATVTLARIRLGERLSKLQGIGIGLGCVGVILITGGSWIIL